MQLIGLTTVSLLQGLIDLHGRHELSLSEELVDLLDELERGVLLIEDECIDVVDDDWDLALLEEELEQLPVVPLFLIVLGVVETVHLDFSWEVAAEDFSDKEAVIKGPKENGQLMKMVGHLPSDILD